MQMTEPPSKRQRVEQLADNKDQEEVEDVPSHYLCPILQVIMKDPVSAADGHSYERHAITQWLQKGNLRSPLSGAELGNIAFESLAIGAVAESKTLTPNHALRCSIEEYIKQRPRRQQQQQLQQTLELAAKGGQAKLVHRAALVADDSPALHLSFKPAPDEVKRWLESLHMPQYTQMLVENGFDSLGVIARAEERHFEKIGVKLGHAIGLVHGASQLLAAESRPECEFALGLKLELGDGVARNVDEALKHYQRAAELGSKDAMVKVALSLLREPASAPSSAAAPSPAPAPAPTPAPAPLPATEPRAAQTAAPSAAANPIDNAVVPVSADDDKMPFVWKIPDFAEKVELLKKGERVYSEEFTKCGRRWKLFLMFNPIFSAYMSLFMEALDQKRAIVKFRIEVFHPERNKALATKTEESWNYSGPLSSDHDRGFWDLLPRDEIPEAMHQGALTIRCYMGLRLLQQ